MFPVAPPHVWGATGLHPLKAHIPAARLLDDLYALMERLGVRSLDEIRGCARAEAAPET